MTLRSVAQFEYNLCRVHALAEYLMLKSLNFFVSEIFFTSIYLIVRIRVSMLVVYFYISI